ncbi:inositol polyphosphate 5-phosphatase OCRL [Ischnura elegans]|uniref:inositol polyphosphate 5-phosphatase OCRL n=1 Tax=Ischnura elegans TaxID=197161 RepID=UPI001ED86A6F|nr:inositol polyphosphate 5-phosphatase OCRL [Ischnura elegans]
MANFDQLSIVQSKLSSGEIVTAVHEASLLQEFVRAPRVLALAEHQGNHAFFVFISSRFPVQLFSDLTLERVIPIDSDFRCELDTGAQHQVASDVFVNISSRKLKLLFEMPSGSRTGEFVSEVFRAIEVSTKRRGPPPEFKWLHKYIPPSNRNSGSFNMDGSIVEVVNKSPSGQPGDADDFLTKVYGVETLYDLESPDIAVPRQSIAKGATPIAARETVIRHQMTMKEDDYTYTQVFRVYVGTWNVNGQPPSVNLSDWLAHDPDPPDIYAIGFQELDLSKEAFLFNDTPREEEWQEAVINGLHPKAKYSKVKLVRLVGMMLIVFVQEQHLAYVQGVAVETVGTGIMGKMGNKGGVAIRFKLHSTSFCFVNSHLAAHVEEYERRNQDYHDICSRLSFSQSLPPKGIKDHDQVYWLGDLNYRITELDPKSVKDLIDQENYLRILSYDQFHQQRALKQVFVGYEEGPITFRPTYKYDPGTDDWDSSEKNRAPAWCDRILWKGEGVKQVAYRSHQVLKISDHKPVSALFDAEVKVIDIAKYRKIHEEVMKKLDKLENEFLPQVMVDNTEIILDTVYYNEAQTKDLIIANTGQVPVQFEFVKKLDDTTYCKDWLHIEPYMGFIKPGEKCDVKLKVLVDKKSACKMNSGEDKLYDILVLHLDGGKDIFITITGTYEWSCFGSSIEALVHISVPLRDIPVGKLMELEKGCLKDVPSTQEPYPIPKEIWFLVDHLYCHGLRQQHLFIQPGLPHELVLIRTWLDYGSPEPLPGSVHSVAEALVLLLESTAEPIIPFNLHKFCFKECGNYKACKQIVMELPEFRKNVFLYLCAFLQEVLSHMNENGLDANVLAMLFGGIFLRDPPRRRGDSLGSSKGGDPVIDRKKANFVHHFLVNDQSDFLLGH